MVEISNLSGVELPEEAVEGLVRAVLEHEQARGALALSFVDEATISELNEDFRSEEGPTDVLSFAYGEVTDMSWPEPKEENGGLPELGEVVVCPQVVKIYAAEEGNTPGKQLAWTLIHGVLHILGYDHECDQGEMRAREHELLALFEDYFPALDF